MHVLVCVCACVFVQMKKELEYVEAKVGDTLAHSVIRRCSVRVVRHAFVYLFEMKTMSRGSGRKSSIHILIFSLECDFITRGSTSHSAQARAYHNQINTKSWTTLIQTISKPKMKSKIRKYISPPHSCGPQPITQIDNL